MKNLILPEGKLILPGQLIAPSPNIVVLDLEEMQREIEARKKGDFPPLKPLWKIGGVDVP